MKRQFLPYYISRAVLSGLFSILVFGFTVQALVLAGILFGLFFIYLHSGWFSIDPTNPFFPIRRDERGRGVQRKALIAALIAGTGVFLVRSALSLPAGMPAAAAPLAISLSVIVYFASQFLLLAR